MNRRRWLLAVSAAAGVALLGWTVWSVGARELASQLNAVAPTLPLLLVLAGGRFFCQAAGWRLAMPPQQRPEWREVWTAVVAGEAAGYFTWGPLSREPMKALLVEHRLPKRDGLAAAVVERTAYSIAATGLIVLSIAFVAWRLNRASWIVAAVAVISAIAAIGARYWRRIARTLDRQSLGELFVWASNVIEAYLVLSWLGASPTWTSVIVLEGVGRLLNGAGQFIPGKLGVTEAATAAVADMLQLGAAHGLSLALARRVRSLAWGAIGIAFVAARAARPRLETA
jgi:hypothetical protein